jgi:CheY-like chemotaxis protein
MGEIHYPGLPACLSGGIGVNSPRWRGVDRLPATAQTIRIRVFLLLAIVLTVGGSAHAADLRIGRAAVVITPPTGMPMGGYYRARLSEGVHDDLQAKALVLESGGTKVALVACDLVNLPREFVEKARVLAAEATGIRGSHIMISATHAHTSPEMGSRLRGASEEAMAVARDAVQKIKKVPIILVTADALDETADLARKHDVTTFLTKPIRKSVIIEAVSAVLA